MKGRERGRREGEREKGEEGVLSTINECIYLPGDQERSPSNHGEVILPSTVGIYSVYSITYLTVLVRQGT